MASPNEVKRVVEEKAIPFFHNGGLERLEKAVKLLSEDIATLKEMVEELKANQGYDKVATVRIDDSGRAEIFPKSKTKK